MDSSPDSPGPLQRAGILGELVLFVWMWNQAKALSPIGTGSGIQGRDLLVQAVVVVPPTFVLVWLFLRMRRAALADIGFRSPRPGWIRALFAGAVAGWLIQWLPIPFYWVFEAAGYQAPATPFSLGGSGDLAAGLLGASITGGFMEELVYRGYLLARLERLCSWNGHPRAGLTIAVVSTSLGFGLTHEYQGDYAVLATGIYGLAFSGLFLLARRNLVPAMAAHATLDVLGLLAASR